jgi:hypothetical protein
MGRGGPASLEGGKWTTGCRAEVTELLVLIIFHRIRVESFALIIWVPLGKKWRPPVRLLPVPRGFITVFAEQTSLHASGSMQTLPQLA